MFNLGIVIINYEANEDTLACLHSLEAFGLDLNPVVILIDNSETHFFDSQTISNFKLHIHFYKNKTNIGFASAVNQGLEMLEATEADCFLLLNNDILLVDDSLQRMLTFLQLHPKVGVVGGINYFDKQPELLWQAGFKNKWMGGAAKIIPVSEYERVDYVPGSVFMGRMDLLQQIGFFDENYFMYFEENDFCKRVGAVSREVAILNNTRFLHKADGRDRKDSPFLFYYMSRNEVYFMQKHHTFIQKIIAIPYLCFYNALRALYYEIVNSQKSYRGLFIKSYFYALKHIFTNQWGRFSYIENFRK